VSLHSTMVQYYLFVVLIVNITQYHPILQMTSCRCHLPSTVVSLVLTQCLYNSEILLYMSPNGRAVFGAPIPPMLSEQSDKQESSSHCRTDVQARGRPPTQPRRRGWGRFATEPVGREGDLRRHSEIDANFNVLNGNPGVDKGPMGRCLILLFVALQPCTQLYSMTG